MAGHDCRMGPHPMTRRALTHTTSIHTGLLDANGNPIPVHTIDIEKLPLIDRRALLGLPRDMEARLLGEDAIVLYCPDADLHVEMPLLERGDMGKYVGMLREAQQRQGMGEAPEDGGYRVCPQPT